MEKSERNWATMLLFSIFLGVFGIHRFYAGKIGTGVLWLLTGGLLGIGWIIDILLVLTYNFLDADGKLIKP